VHSSIVSCHSDFVRALQAQGEAETTGADNLKTLQLIFDAYKSMRTGQAINY
jgi:predicted dehydrogenase